MIDKHKQRTYETGVVQCLCYTNKPATLWHSVNKTTLQAADEELMIAGCRVLQTVTNFSQNMQEQLNELVLSTGTSHSSALQRISSPKFQLFKHSTFHFEISEDPSQYEHLRLLIILLFFLLCACPVQRVICIRLPWNGTHEAHQRIMEWIALDNGNHFIPILLMYHAQQTLHTCEQHSPSPPQIAQPGNLGTLYINVQAYLMLPCYLTHLAFQKLVPSDNATSPVPLGQHSPC